MKKFLAILVLGLMLSSNVYAASISDLLGSKKSVILKCITDNAYSYTPSGIEDNPQGIGAVQIWEIRDGKYFYWDGEQKSFGQKEEFVDEYGDFILNKLTITEDKYLWQYRLTKKEDNKFSQEQVIEIARNSGQFTSTVNHKKFNSTHEGTCEKVTDKKL